MSITPQTGASPEQVGEWDAAKGNGPDVEIQALLSTWADQAAAASTLERLGGLAERFAARLAVTGVASITEATLADCEGFMWAPTRRNAPPSSHTVHLRRTALRGMFNVLRQLDPNVSDPTVDVELPGRGGQRTRPLTDEEMDLVRTAALGRARQPLRGAAAVALAEATATTGEIPRVRWCDVNVDAGVVDLAGADPVGARRGQLTGWGVGVLHRWRALTDGPPRTAVIAHRTATNDSHGAQAATANLLIKLLTGAGVRSPGVRPSSIRLWGAAATLSAEGIEAAARALGVDSLDVAATVLHHHWQEHS